jgi:transposase
MHVFYHLPKEFYQLVKRTPRELSPIAKSRMQTIIAWQALREAGYSADKASKKLGVARSTVYRWQKRLRVRNLRGLEDDSRRPKRLRTMCWSVELIETALELRETYPRWGK